MNAFVAHFSFEFRTGVRNRTLLLLTYLFPLAFYLMMGVLMPGLSPYFLPTMVPAMVVFAVLAATLLGLPDPLVNAREAGIFRSFRINGVATPAVLSIPALTITVHLVVVTAVIGATAPLLFRAPAPENWGGFALAFLVTASACAAISVLIGVVSSSSRTQILWSQLVFLPSMLLGGMMVPYDQLSGAMAGLARLLPATHAMNAFKGLAMAVEADFDPWVSVGALTTSAAVAFALALFLFSWDVRNTKRRGPPVLALAAVLPLAATLLV